MSSPHGRSCDRQPHERASCRRPPPTIERQLAAEPLDERAREEQPEAHAAPRRLGGEERLAGARQHRRRACRRRGRRPRCATRPFRRARAQRAPRRSGDRGVLRVLDQRLQRLRQRARRHAHALPVDARRGRRRCAARRASPSTAPRSSSATRDLAQAARPRSRRRRRPCASRMARQRSTCARISCTSSSDAASACAFRAGARAPCAASAIVDERRRQLVRRAGRQRGQRRQPLLAIDAPLRVGQLGLARLERRAARASGSRR